MLEWIVLISEFEKFDLTLLFTSQSVLQAIVAFLNEHVTKSKDTSNVESHNPHLEIATLKYANSIKT